MAQVRSNIFSHNIFSSLDLKNGLDVDSELTTTFSRVTETMGRGKRKCVDKDSQIEKHPNSDAFKSKSH